MLKVSHNKIHTAKDTSIAQLKQLADWLGYSYDCLVAAERSV